MKVCTVQKFNTYNFNQSWGICKHTAPLQWMFFLIGVLDKFDFCMGHKIRNSNFCNYWNLRKYDF